MPKFPPQQAIKRAPFFLHFKAYFTPPGLFLQLDFNWVCAMRRAVLAVLLTAAALPAFAAGPIAAKKTADVSLSLDEVHTLTFHGPVATVYVGNPSIADITMIDARHAFVLGKAYGRTNIVALNSDGAQVFGTHVTVTGNDTAGTVTLNRGAQRVTYSCTGNRCEPTPVPGDGKDAFESANSQNGTHQSAAKSAAGAGTGG